MGKYCRGQCRGQPSDKPRQARLPVSLRFTSVQPRGSFSQQVAHTPRVPAPHEREPRVNRLK